MFISKKIRQLMEALDKAKKPEDLQNVVDKIQDQAPQNSSIGFEKNLRQKLLIKHAAMAASGELKTNNKSILNTTNMPNESGKNSSDELIGKFKDALAWIKEKFAHFGGVIGGSSGWFKTRGLSMALAAFILVTIVGIAGYPAIPAPMVSGYELKDAIRKIAYNAPIKVTFNQMMDRGSVEKSFKIEPAAAGHFDWSFNTMMFYPDTQFKVGESYKVLISQNAKSLIQKHLKHDYQEVFEIVEAPKVLLFSPAPDSENIDVSNKITLMFDRPMTELSTLDAGQARAPEIKIEPKVSGKYKWLGTDSISFVPDKLMYATKYTVTLPQGTKSLDGGQTDKDFIYSFTTIKPALLQTDPMDLSKYNGPKTKIRLDFNQPISLDSAKQSIHVYQRIYKEFKDFDKGGPYQLTNFDAAGWQTVDFSAGYLTEQDITDNNPVVPYTGEPATNMDSLNGMQAAERADLLKKTLMIKPNSLLNYDNVYLVKIDKTLAGAEGTFTLENDQAVLFRTVSDINIVTSNPVDGADLNKKGNEANTFQEGESYRLGNAEIVFSQPMDLNSMQEKVVITPSKIDKDTKAEIKPNLSLGGADNTALEINYDFSPSTKYTVSLKAGSKDLFGKTYDKDFSFSFTTSALKPEFHLAKNSDISVLDSNKPKVYYLKSTNVDFVNLKLRKLTKEEFYSVYGQGYVYGDPLAALASVPLAETQKKIKHVFNEQAITKLDLEKEFNSTFAPGVYYLEATNPNVVDPYKKIVPDRQIFVVSGAALAVKESSDQLLVWATSMLNGAPVEGMNVDLVNADHVKALSGVTDKSGLITFDLNQDKKTVRASGYAPDYLVVGQKDSDFALVHTSWGEGVSPWDFSLSYNGYASNYYIYSYTDRPIYRPGHDVYFKGLVRKDVDATFKLPDAKTVHVTVYDPQGEKVFEKDLDLNSNGTFNGQLKLGEKARTGTYQITTSLNGVADSDFANQYSASFRIAEYRKPDYQINLTADKDSYINGEKAKVKVKASYFFGAPLSNAEITWNLNNQDYYFFLNPDKQSPYSGQWYSFSDDGYSCMWGCGGTSGLVTSGKATLDANGEFVIELPLDISSKKLSQIYTLEVTAKNLNNQTVSNRVSMPVNAGEYYLGILNQDYVVNKGDPVKFQLISVDSNGQPVAGKKVDVEFFKRNWNTVKKKNVDSDFYYENNFEDISVDKKSVTTNDKGYAEVGFEAKDGGDFKATATSKDSRGNKIIASTSVFVSSSDFVNWGRDNNDKIELVPDKQEYKPGDTAHVLIKSPYQNVYALITEERQNVISKRVVKIKSNSDTFDLPITDKSIPNIFVSVLLIKGDNAAAGLAEPAAGANDERSVAAFKMGYITLQVNTSTKKLNVDLQVDKGKYKPGDEVTLKVKTTDINGKTRPAEVSIAVVDKSVLSLVQSVTADLLNEFYRQRFLGVMTAETLTKAISRVNVQVEAGIKGGGGGEIKKRGTFKDTAFWQAVVNTDAKGEGTVKFKVPDNLTTWEVLAIGITKDTLVGSKKSEFVVTKDVMVRPVLPRFLIVDDRMKVGAIVHNYLDKGTSFVVSLGGTGLNFASGGEPRLEAGAQTVYLAPGEEKKVEWDATVLNAAEAVLTFEVQPSSQDAAGDLLEQKLPIHPYSFPEVVATSETINDGDKHVENVWLPLGVDKNFGELTVKVAPTLATSIAEGLQYLMTFPYGCVEQTTSSLLPNVVIKQVLNLPALKNSLVDEKQLQKNVESGLQALYKYQQANGGWGIWQTSETTPYLTSYVLFALNQAQKAGYTVDENVIKQGLNFLTGYMNSHPLQKWNGGMSLNDLIFKSNLSYDANVRAYALYVLAEMGKGDLALSNNLYEVKDSLNLFSKAYLAMTFDILRKANPGMAADLGVKIDSLKNEVLNKAKESPRGVHFEEADHQYRLFDTNTRTTALVLQMLSRINPENAYIPKIMRYLMLERQGLGSKGGVYMSTQETSITLLAMVDYLKSGKELEPNFRGVIAVNGQAKIDKSYLQKNISDKDEVVVALKDLLLDNQNNEITATKTGVGKMYFDMTLRYFLPTEKIKPRNEGMIVTHEYFADNDKKFEHPIKDVKVGSNLKGRITVVVPEDRYYVMVEDFLPAGLEAVDFNLNTSQQSLMQNAYMDGKGMGDSYYSIDGKGGFTNNAWFFNYSEVRDDRVMYFADYLPKGVYEIDYFARATTPGMYHDLPVLGQELYFPEVFGRSGGAMFEVKE